MNRHGRVVTLVIPSVRGSEKIVMSVGECIAAQMGFARKRIDQLRTALAEACMNAMEHGNQFQRELPVTVEFRIARTRLEITIDDVGTHEHVGAHESQENTTEPFDIDAKVSGRSHRRGWGLFLIRNLVDEFSTEVLPNCGRRVRMVDFLQHMNSR